MDEEDVNLKRVYAHQNAELDKRACFFFLYYTYFVFCRLGFSRTKLSKNACSYFFFFFFFHQIYKG
jgi:hypothetical protein